MHHPCWVQKPWGKLDTLWNEKPLTNRGWLAWRCQNVCFACSFLLGATLRKLCVQLLQIILALLDGKLASLWLFQYLHSVSRSFSSSPKDFLNWKKKKKKRKIPSYLWENQLGRIPLVKTNLELTRKVLKPPVSSLHMADGWVEGLRTQAVGQTARVQVSALLVSGYVILAV